MASRRVTRSTVRNDSEPVVVSTRASQLRMTHNRSRQNIDGRILGVASNYRASTHPYRATFPSPPFHSPPVSGSPSLNSSNRLQVESDDANAIPCPVCLEDMHPRNGLALATTGCGHVYCYKCLVSWLKIRPMCPKCFAPCPKGSLIPIYL